MKRLIVLGFAIMALGANSFANSNSVVEKLNNEKTQNAVARFLDVDFQQKSDLNYIFKESSKKFDKEIAKGASIEQASQKALFFNLANARVILSPEQYKKFVSVLNITINNNLADASLLAEK